MAITSFRLLRPRRSKNCLPLDQLQGLKGSAEDERKEKAPTHNTNKKKTKYKKAKKYIDYKSLWLLDTRFIVLGCNGRNALVTQWREGTGDNKGLWTRLWSIMLEIWELWRAVDGRIDVKGINYVWLAMYREAKRGVIMGYRVTKGRGELT